MHHNNEKEERHSVTRMPFFPLTILLNPRKECLIKIRFSLQCIFQLPSSNRLHHPYAPEA